MEMKETWKEGIKITDLKEGDVIYIKKIKSDYDYHYECKFISFEKGIVKAEIVFGEREENWKMNQKDIKGQIITARPSKCYLWGKEPNKSKWAFCHWFEKGGTNTQ